MFDKIVNWFKDAILFVKNIGSIVVAWLKEYGFINLIILVLALVLWFGFAGKFWAYWGHAAFWFFLGRNVVALKRVWVEIVKPKLGIK